MADETKAKPTKPKESAKPAEGPSHWRGMIILHEAHAPELEARAAVHELGNGLAPQDAHERAYAEYLHGHMTRAAAHHLAGLRAAHAAGDVETAARHGMTYGVIMRTLGHDPHGAPPPEIHEMSSDPLLTHVYDYRPHGLDAVLAEVVRQKKGGEPLKRSEGGDSHHAHFIGGHLLASHGGYDVWDSSHLLSSERRKRGERLYVHEQNGQRHLHHLRVDGDARVPLAVVEDRRGKLAMSEGGQPGAKGGEPAEIPEDVLAAMTSAAKGRRVAQDARAAIAARSIDRVMQHLRRL